MSGSRGKDGRLQDQIQDLFANYAFRLTSTVSWAYHNIKLVTERKLLKWRFLIKEDAPEMSRRQPKPIRTETGNWVDRWKSRTLCFDQFFAPEFFFSAETKFSNDANEIHFCSATCLKSCKSFFLGCHQLSFLSLDELEKAFDYRNCWIAVLGCPCDHNY